MHAVAYIHSLPILVLLTAVYYLFGLTSYIYQKNCLLFANTVFRFPGVFLQSGTPFTFCNLVIGTVIIKVKKVTECLSKEGQGIRPKMQGKERE
jgi:hypothetical protein